MVWGKDQGLVFLYGNPVDPETFIVKTILFPLNYTGTLVVNKKTTCAWVYFGLCCFLDLFICVPMPHYKNFWCVIVQVLQIVFHFIVLTILVFLQFHTNLRISLSVSYTHTYIHTHTHSHNPLVLCWVWS